MSPAAAGTGSRARTGFNAELKPTRRRRPGAIRTSTGGHMSTSRLHRAAACRSHAAFAAATSPKLPISHLRPPLTSRSSHHASTSRPCARQKYRQRDTSACSSLPCQVHVSSAPAHPRSGRPMLPSYKSAAAGPFDFPKGPLSSCFTLNSPQKHLPIFGRRSHEQISTDHPTTDPSHFRKGPPRRNPARPGAAAGQGASPLPASTENRCSTPP
jgi:hypothetical protein